MTLSTSPSVWSHLPPELRLSILDELDFDDAKSCSYVDSETRSMSIPFIFKSLKLKNYEQLMTFISDVPSPYYSCLRRLDVCTKPADEDATDGADEIAHPRTSALIALLVHCTQLEQLSLELYGSLDKCIIPYFRELRSIRKLSINNCGDGTYMPISERLVVSIAASIPRLEQLSLSCISRSMMHAPELIGAYPFVPIVSGDENIEDHPLVGSELSLPSLLRIPTLRRLVIRDTHLGDPRWENAEVACPLEILDLGSSYHETEEFNRLCTERIIENVCATIGEFTLNTSYPNEEQFSTRGHRRPSISRMKQLRKLHVTPLVGVSDMVETLATLSSSPVERISVQCLKEDVVDICSALEEFLSMRVERGGSAFYKHLSEIQVTISEDFFAQNQPDGPNGGFAGAEADGRPMWSELDADSDQAERVLAAKRLQEFCRDLRLSGSGVLALADACDEFVCIKGSRGKVEEVYAELKGAVEWR